MAAAEEDVSRGVKEEVSVKEEVKVEQVREPAIFEYSTGLCDCEENCPRENFQVFSEMREKICTTTLKN